MQQREEILRETPETRIAWHLRDNKQADRKRQKVVSPCVSLFVSLSLYLCDEPRWHDGK